MNLRIPSSPRILWCGWIGLTAIALLVLGILFVWLPRTSQTGRVVRDERRRLGQQLQEIEKQIQSDQGRYISVLKRFPWIIDGAGGTTFLTRLSEVAAGQQLGISGVGPLERKKIGQVERIGRKIKVISSFSDVIAFIENTERNLGFIDGLKIEKLDLKGQTKGLRDLLAQFNMVTVELNPEFSKKLRSLVAFAAAPSAAKAKEADRSLGPPSSGAEATLKPAPLRNPFRAAAPLVAAGKPAVGADGGEASPFSELRFSGIVSLPNKKIAIINNQMVQEGEHVGQVLVERITDSEVVLKLGSEAKHIRLRAFASETPGKE